MFSINAVIKLIISLFYFFTFTFMLVTISVILKIVTFKRLFNKGIKDA
jgi:hypothetical protein